MSKPKPWQNFLRYVVIIIWALIAIFPFYWMTTMAFKPKNEWTSAAGTIYWVPQEPTMENFQTVLTEYRGKFFRGNQESALPAIRSSIIISIAGTLFALVIGTLAAYGISRFTTETGTFPWYIALGRLLLLVLAVMPFMLLWARTGIIQTWWGIATFSLIGILADNLIARGLARIVMLHHPPHKTGASIGRGLMDAGAFETLIARHGAELIIHGHNHKRSVKHLRGPDRKQIPVVGVASASAAGGSRTHRAGYNLFSVARDGEGFAITAHARGLMDDRTTIGDLGQIQL